MQYPSSLGPNPSLPQPTQAPANFNGPMAPVPGEPFVFNSNWPVGYAPRYGPLPDGVRNDSPTIQAAMNAARLFGADLVIPQLSNSPWLLKDDIDATFGPADSLLTRKPVRVVGVGSRYGFQFAMLKISKTGGIGFDLTGSQLFIFDNLVITGDSVNRPAAAFLCARNTSGGGAGLHQFNKCFVVGEYSSSTIYCYGAEECAFNDCYVENRVANNARVLTYTSRNNIAPTMASTFQTIAVGAQSSYTMYVNGGSWFANSGSGDVFFLDSVTGVRAHRYWAASGSSVTGGRSIVFVDQTNGESQACSFVGVNGENIALLPQYGVRFANGAARLPASWAISGIFATVVAAVSGDANTTLYGATLGPFTDHGTVPAPRAVDLVNSRYCAMLCLPNNVRITGTSTQDFIVCSAATIGAIAGSAVFDLTGAIFQAPTLTAMVQMIAPAYGTESSGTAGQLRCGGDTIATYGPSTTGLKVNGEIGTLTAGYGLSIKSGANCRVDATATLVAGTVVVANTSIQATDIIILCGIGGGVAANRGRLDVTARINGTSFTVTSSNALDTSNFSYMIVRGA